MYKILLLLAIIAMAGCATGGAPRAHIGSYKLLVSMEGRTGVTLIECGPRGVVYTVFGRDRQLLVSRATLAELKEQDPQKGQEMERTVVWAGL